MLQRRLWGLLAFLRTNQWRLEKLLGCVGMYVPRVLLANTHISFECPTRMLRRGGGQKMTTVAKFSTGFSIGSLLFHSGNEYEIVFRFLGILKPKYLMIMVRDRPLMYWGLNMKLGLKSQIFGSPVRYISTLVWLPGPLNGRFCCILARMACWLVIEG